MKTLKIFSTLASSCFLVFLSSCGGYVSINRMEGYAAQKENIQKIIYIAPQAFVFNSRNYEEINNFKTEKHQKGIETIMQKMAKDKSSKIDLVLLPKNFQGLKEDYLKYLVPLKNEILLHVQMQDNPLNSASRKHDQRISRQVFVVPIKVSPQWSKLSSIYGTPYFGFVGSFSNESKTVVVNYVLDVNKGELIYQSLSATYGSVGTVAISHLIYDSIYLMNHTN